MADTEEILTSDMSDEEEEVDEGIPDVNFFPVSVTCRLERCWLSVINPSD